MASDRVHDGHRDDGAGHRPVVHIVDDEAGIRAFISFALQRAGYATEIYASGREFLEVLARAGAEGCVLLDYRMPGMDGLEVLAALARDGVDVAPVLMTGHGDIPLAVSAMKSGAVDFIEKPIRVERLLATVAHALEGRKEAQAIAVERSRARSAFDELARREQDIVRGLLAGMSNKMIAKVLGLSPRTVEDYRLSMTRKLEASSAAEVIRLAISAGVEPLDSGDEQDC